MHITQTLLRKPHLPFGYTRAVAKVLRLLTLKPIKEFHFQFDPFTGNAQSLREVMFMLQTKKILRTNPQAEFKAIVVDDRSEPTIRTKFADGQQYLIKSKNLSGLEIMEQLDRLAQVNRPVPFRISWLTAL